MDGRLWLNPIYARIFFKYLLAQTVNFKSERYDEIRVLALCARCISYLLSSLPLKLVSIGCKRNITYIAIHPDTWLTDSVQNSRGVDRRTLYVNGWTPLAEPNTCKNLLQISPRAKSQFQLRKVWWNTGTFFMYTMHQLLAKFLASQNTRLSMRCLRHQRVDHKCFLVWISGNPGPT